MNMRDLRSWIVVVLCTVAAGCAPKAAPAAEVQKQVQTAFEQKMRWILELEDARQLRGGGGDLLTLLNDAEEQDYPRLH